jgi:hypothetical protein
MSFDPAPEFPSYSVVFTWKSVGLSACDKVIQVWVTMENARGRRRHSAAKHPSMAQKVNGKMQGWTSPRVRSVEELPDPR